MNPVPPKTYSTVGALSAPRTPAKRGEKRRKWSVLRHRRGDRRHSRERPSGAQSEYRVTGVPKGVLERFEMRRKTAPAVDARCGFPGYPVIRSGCSASRTWRAGTERLCCSGRSASPYGDEEGGWACGIGQAVSARAGSAGKSNVTNASLDESLYRQHRQRACPAKEPPSSTHPPRGVPNGQETRRRWPRGASILSIEAFRMSASSRSAAGRR